ncbi:MAG: hypothetical protein ACOYVF_12475 [Candidatus Zixiibacteriota bacterium]
MIIKSFTAESAAAALKKVRSEMGGDAVVLKTRELGGRNREARVEITACLDKPTAAQASNIFPDRKPVANRAEVPKENEPPLHQETSMVSGKSAQTAPAAETPVISITKSSPEMNDRLAMVEAKLDILVNRLAYAGMTANAGDRPATELYQKLQDADFAADYLETLFDRLDGDVQGSEAAYRAVCESLAADLTEIIEPGFTFEDGSRVLVYGPAGTGKSSVMGKLAARMVCEKKKVKLLSLDNLKVGAYEELASYADLLGVDVVNPTEIETSDKKKSEEIILIDSLAMPLVENRLNAFRLQVEQVKPTHRILVLSSLMRSGDIADMAETIDLLQPTHLVMTMTDLTSRWGSVMTVCRRLGIKLIYTTDSPAGIGRVNMPSVEQFIRTVLKEEVALEQA